METHKTRILKDFSAWLREAFEDHGGTQVEFAKSIGAKQEQVSRWLNGHFAPTLPTMREIAKRLKRSLPASIIGREDSDADRVERERDALKAEVARLRAEVARLYAVAGQLQPLPVASKPSKHQP